MPALRRARPTPFLSTSTLLLLTLFGCASLATVDPRRGDQFMASGSWEEAMTAYQLALKEDPFNPSLQHKFELARERTASKYEEQGRTYLKERQIELAVEAFKRALTLEPMNRAHQEGLTEGLRLKEAGNRVREAEKLAQLGRREDAFQAYTHAAELDPSSDKASEGIARLSEQEEAEESVLVDYHGEGLEIGFNVSYLVDVLSVLDADTVKITLADSNSSALIESAENGDSMYVVMPMRL